jgi:hypothetical protein
VPVNRHATTTYDLMPRRRAQSAGDEPAGRRGQVDLTGAGGKLDAAFVVEVDHLLQLSRGAGEPDPLPARDGV